FSRRTATLRTTTPASSTADRAIHAALPAMCGRAATARRATRAAVAASADAAGATLANLHRGAQPRRRSARVPRQLGLGRADRAPRERAQDGLLAADADGEVGRAGAATLLASHELLDDPILERVEADDGDPPARPQDLDRRR